MPRVIQFPDSPARFFAVDVVRRLRDVGFESVWAGGCVRDVLLGRPPVDFDIATSARPDDIIRLFGKKRSISVGAAFGVIIVLGRHRDQGQVEVATFRCDGNYSDGRRPDHVTYCSAKEDACRRDFTINGMFYDPLEERFIDYVGGRQDLSDRIVRVIGIPAERFGEDKLRMLRAVRFTAAFDFVLDQDTADAVRTNASGLRQVSVERIAGELRRMLTHPSRARAVHLLKSTGLLPEIFPHLRVHASALQEALQILPHLSVSRFEPALCLLLQSGDETFFSSGHKQTAFVEAECQRLRLSNDELEDTKWLAETLASCHAADRLPLHKVKPLLSDPRRDLLLDLLMASGRAGVRSIRDAEFLASYLARVDKDVLNPKPFLSGTDLKTLGVPAGPDFSRILRQVRNEQLDEIIQTRTQALSRAAELKTPE